ncbi:50S ribosomal protein L25 [Candidatus Hepatincolaceae symbiont of Richtersius coronifer]
MTDQFVFTAVKREKVGKGAARATRRSNLVPATIYGDSKDPISVSLNPKELLSQMIKSSIYTTIYKIKHDSKDEEVLVRKVQLHPVTDVPLHVDLLRVGEKTTTRLIIPIVFINQAKSPGLKLGGSLNVVNHYLEVMCNPKNAPKQIEIDLGEAKIGTVIKIEDIELGKGSKTYYPKGFALASITASNEEEATKVEGVGTSNSKAATPAKGAAAKTPASSPAKSAAPAKTGKK